MNSQVGLPGLEASSRQTTELSLIRFFFSSGPVFLFFTYAVLNKPDLHTHQKQRAGCLRVNRPSSVCCKKQSWGCWGLESDGRAATRESQSSQEATPSPKSLGEIPSDATGPGNGREVKSPETTTVGGARAAPHGSSPSLALVRRCPTPSPSFTWTFCAGFPRWATYMVVLASSRAHSSRKPARNRAHHNKTAPVREGFFLFLSRSPENRAQVQLCLPSLLLPNAGGC